MKKKTIGLLITLMTITLGGIIAVQVYWINLALQVKEDQFNRSVFHALNNINQKIDSFRAVEFIGESIINIKSKNNTISNVMTWTSYGDSDLNNRFNEKEIIYLTDSADNLIVKKHLIHKNYDDIKKVHITKDSLVEFQINMDTDENHNVFFEKKDSFLSAENKIRTTIKQLAREINAKDIDINSLVNDNDLKLIIHEELKDIGIDTIVKYVVYNEEKDSLISNLSSGNIASDIIKSDYKIKMFPNNLINRSYSLILQFPNKNKQLYKSLLLWLLASVIFTSIIIILFTTTIRIIIKQKKLSEIKTDFINNMTHEFKTPIATISLAVDSISNEKIIHSPEKINPLLNVIKEENSRMNKQVENVLQMSLIDKKDFNFQFKEIDIHQYILKAIKNIEVQVIRKEGHIETSLLAEQSLLQLDENYFMNILFNLLDNANKYSPEKPQILVSTYNNKEGIFIRVKDHGIGMKKELQDRIFEKFYRLPTGNVHDIKGFGLGLSYVQAIIFAFNGKIEVKSEPGLGSEFILFLPFHQNGVKN